MKVHNCGVVVSCGVCKNSYHPPSQIVVAAPPLCRLLVLYFKNNLVRVTRCAGRVVALGGDSPISLPYELVGTVSSTAGNGAQKRFARFPPTCYLVLFPPAVAGVFRFRPRRNFYPVLFPYRSVPSRDGTLTADSDGSGRLFKIQSYFFGPRVYSGSTQFSFS